MKNGEKEGGVREWNNESIQKDGEKMKKETEIEIEREIRDLI